MNNKSVVIQSIPATISIVEKIPLYKKQEAIKKYTGLNPSRHVAHVLWISFSLELPKR